MGVITKMPPRGAALVLVAVDCFIQIVNVIVVVGLALVGGLDVFAVLESCITNVSYKVGYFNVSKACTIRESIVADKCHTVRNGYIFKTCATTERTAQNPGRIATDFYTYKTAAAAESLGVDLGHAFGDSYACNILQPSYNPPLKARLSITLTSSGMTISPLLPAGHNPRTVSPFLFLKYNIPSIEK